MADCIDAHVRSPPADIDSKTETHPPPEYPAVTIAILRLAVPALLRVQGACVARTGSATPGKQTAGQPARTSYGLGLEKRPVPPVFPN